MADLRNLDLTATDGGLKTNALMRNPVALSASTTYNNEYFGFFVNAIGGVWSYTPIDGKAAITFTPTASTWYPMHVSEIQTPAGATGFADIGGVAQVLNDTFSSMTFSGTATTDATSLTVAIGDSASLTSASSVLPVIGAKYRVSFKVSSYDSSTAATITYGGVDVWDDGTTGNFGVIVTASAATGLAIVATGITTADWVVEDLKIERV